MHKLFQYLLLLFTLTLHSFTYAGNDIQASYYWDSRDYNTVTLQVSENELGRGFSFWGFTDFNSTQQNTDDRYDLSRTFSEYRLSNDRIGNWTDIKGLGLQLEYNDSTPGESNNTLRLGLTYQQSLTNLGWLQYRAFPLQTKNDGQLSLIFFLKLNDRLNISGFVDYNFIDGAKDQWVYEPQLNYRLTDHVWLLIEHRYNGFENSIPSLKGTGNALGFRYNFN